MVDMTTCPTFARGAGDPAQRDAGRRAIGDHRTVSPVRSDIELRADVVIVGAGAAGAAAALEVVAAGGSFVGLDRLDAFGGTATTSGGGVCVGGTSFQRSRGVADSPGLALRDHLDVADGLAHDAWARFYYERAVEDVFEWLVGLGVEFVTLHDHEETSVARWHGPRDSGRGLMSAMIRALEARRMADDWSYGVTVDELIVEGMRVVGVAGSAADGGRVVARGRAVVLATGGFAGSYEEVLRLAPALRGAERVLVGGGAGAVGLGHRLVAGIGAAFEGLDRLWIYAHATPDPRDASGRRGLVLRGLESAIWVNRAGLRFHDESLVGPGSATPALLAQEGATCWAILDRPMLERIRIADPRFRDYATRVAAIEGLVVESPDIAVADSATDLARAAGIEAGAFARTFEAWNALLESAADAGVDPDTGRRLAGVVPFSGPPYYAIRFVPLVRKNLGGVRTDLRGRVLGGDERPIPGLYAAGELAGFGGGHLAGRRAPEGIMLGGSLFGGRVAGTWAAAEAGRGGLRARWGGETGSGA